MRKAKKKGEKEGEEGQDEGTFGRSGMQKRRETVEDPTSNSGPRAVKGSRSSFLQSTITQINHL